MFSRDLWDIHLAKEQKKPTQLLNKETIKERSCGTQSVIRTVVWSLNWARNWDISWHDVIEEMVSVEKYPYFCGAACLKRRFTSKTGRVMQKRVRCLFLRRIKYTELFDVQCMWRKLQQHSSQTTQSNSVTANRLQVMGFSFAFESKQGIQVFPLSSR